MAVTSTIRNLSGWTPVSQDIDTISTDYHFDFASRAVGVWPMTPVPANAMMLVRFDFISTATGVPNYNSAGSWFVQYRFASSALEFIEELDNVGDSGHTLTFSASGNNMRMTANMADANSAGDLTVVPTIVLAQIS